MYFLVLFKPYSVVFYNFNEAFAPFLACMLVSFFIFMSKTLMSCQEENLTATLVCAQNIL